MAQPQQHQEGVAIPPPYSVTCQCSGCKKPAAYTIVLNLWAIDDLPAFRGPHNAVRMFPAIVACEGHKTMLREIGFYALQKAVGHARALFKALSKAEPDLKDALIDARTIDDAMKQWREPPGHSRLH